MTNYNNIIKSISRGFKKYCPKCGHKDIYSSYIKFFPKCKKCNLNFSKYRTDDGPAYITIFLVGHIIVPLILLTEGSKNPPPIAFQYIFWPILSISLCLWFLPRIKGAFLGIQISVDDRSWHIILQVYKSIMAKSNTIQVKLVSSAKTAYFYVKNKNPKKMTEKIELKKYDPKVRKHVLFKEQKIK